jgi:hypothetical protein
MNIGNKTYKTNLIFFCYLKNNNFIDKSLMSHINALKYYCDVFNGDKIIYISCDSKIENKDEICNLFSFLGNPKIRFVSNFSELRESKYFLEQINQINDLNSFTFYAHAKGATYDENNAPLQNWITAMYFFNLDKLYLNKNLKILDENKTFAGTLRKDLKCPPWVISDWHYSGTFFWFNTKKLFDKNFDFYREGRYEVESFPGNHSDISESYCDERLIFQINADLHSQGHWDIILSKLTENELNRFFNFKKSILENKLTKICNYLGSDKGTTVDEKHSYTEIYESIFILKKDKEINLLEIGIKDPRFPYASVKIFDLYFKRANLIGLDISNSEELEDLIPNFKYYFLDQFSEDSHDLFLTKLTDDMFFDYIIDDGPHIFEAQKNSLDKFFKLLKDDGYYIIEDLHCDNRIVNYVKELNLKYDLYCNDKLIIIHK